MGEPTRYSLRSVRRLIVLGANNSTHQSLPDIVSTQGYYLEGYPGTPVFTHRNNPAFLRELDAALDLLLFRQRLRTHKYGKEDAEEWPPSHTPPELRQRYDEEKEAEQARMEALLEISTPSSDGVVGDESSSAKQLFAGTATQKDVSSKRRQCSSTPPYASRPSILSLASNDGCPRPIVARTNPYDESTAIKRRKLVKESELHLLSSFLETGTSEI